MKPPAAGKLPGIAVRLAAALLLALLGACPATSPPRRPERPASSSPAYLQAWRLLCENELAGARSALERLDRRRAPACRQGRCLLLAGLLSMLRADFLAAQQTLLQAATRAPGSAVSLLAAAKLAQVLQAAPARPRTRAEIHRLSSSPGDTTPGLAELRQALRELLPPEAAGDDRPDPAGDTAPRLWLETGFAPGHPLVLLEQARRGRPPGLAARARACHSSPGGLLQLDPQGRRGLLQLATAVEIVPPPGGAGNRPEAGRPWSGEFLLLVTSQSPLRLRLDGHTVEHYPQLQPLAARRRFLVRAGAGTLRLRLLVPLEIQRRELGLRLLPLQEGTGLHWLAGDDGRPPAGLPDQTAPVLSLQALPGLAGTLAPAGSEDEPSMLLAALAHWQDGRLDRARQLLQRLAGRHPGASLLQFLLAMEVLEDDDIPPPIDQGQALSHLRRAAACPESRLAGFRLALLQAGANQQRRALETLRRLDQQLPAYFLWPYFQGIIAEQGGWPLPARRLYRQALSRWPENPEVLEHLARLYLEQGDLAAARPLAGRLWERRRSRTWLDLLERAGREEELDRARRQLLDRDPLQPELWLQRARFLLNRGETAPGRRCLRRALALAGDDPALLRRAADLLDQAGLAGPARRLWRRLERLQPWQARLRLAAAVRDGSRQLLPDGDRPGDTRAVIRRYRESGWRVNSAAVMVLDHYHLQAFADGSSLLHLHQVIHVRTHQAAERWGEFNPPGDGAVVLALHTIKPDGRTFQAQVVAGKDTVSLPHLAAGDFIELDTLVGQEAPGLPLAGPGWLSPVRELGGIDQPVFRWETSYLLPAGARWRLDRQGRLPGLQQRHLGERTLLRLVADRVEAPQREPLSPPEEELVPSLVVGFSASWEGLRRALAAELRAASRPTAILADRAAAICGASRGRECARRIFHWVCANITARGQSEDLLEPASHVLVRRQGNRLAALVALLRARGWQPRVMLARPLDAPALDSHLPRPGLYHQAVVALPAAGGTLWMVPDGRWHPFDSLDAYLRGARALSLWPEQGPVFVRLPRRHRSGAERRIELELELGADGSLQGRGRETIPAGKAAPYRDILAGLPAGQRRRIIEASLVDSFSTAELEQVKFFALEQPDRPLVVEYRFRAAAYGIFRGDRLVLPGRFFPYRLGHNLPVSLPRSQPLLIGDETRTATRVRLTLPPGWRADDAGPVELRGPLSEFSYRRRQRGNRLVLEKRLLVRPGRVRPRDAADFQHFCRRVDRLDTQPLELVGDDGKRGR